MKKLNHGENLVGDVTQELKLEKEIMEKSGWIKFLGNNIDKWMKEEIGKGITKFIIPIAANQYQSLEKASILIFLKKQSPTTGIAPNNILRNAIVTGPYEYVAILILKKAEAQIRASITRKI